ncbi:MAG: 30S ribosomal protein S6 [Clostridia bacterium]|nr:30S ribosomal protein S6 [Clostridia bacterium]MDD7672691.1 30S ribosomal protein S6 [Clostridia bacterium]MDY2929843.1 30S ribosomal protein S6 [Clostridiaceae bacterium]
MPKITGKYETIFIVNATLTEEAINAVVEKFTNLIAANGEITKIDQWGKRRMAYAIDDMAEGYYVLVEFDSKPDFPAELDRIYKITDGVIRSIIVAKE